MKSQERAAKGVPVIWHVAEYDAAVAMRALLKEAKIKGITIEHTP